MAEKKLITICQSGGEFKTDEDGSLSYSGGEAHAIDIDHETRFENFKSEIAEMLNCSAGSILIKYFLPGNRRTLISISSDKDLQRMINFNRDSVTVDVYVIAGDISVQDGSLEIWLVSPGSVAWHCQLTIQGDSNLRISSLVWCPSGSKKGPSERLPSSSIHGSISEWDLFYLKQKTVLDFVGVSIWQMAVEPIEDAEASLCKVNESAYVKSLTQEHKRVAVGCDDGCVRLYVVPDSDELIYNKEKNVFDKIHQETFGKSGSRSIVPGQYVALDPKGRAVMISACEKQKLVYVLNRDTVGRLAISSPLEAHKRSCRYRYYCFRVRFRARRELICQVSRDCVFVL